MYKIDLFIVKTTDFWATYAVTQIFESTIRWTQNWRFRHIFVCTQ